MVRELGKILRNYKIFQLISGEKLDKIEVQLGMQRFQVKEIIVNLKIGEGFYFQFFDEGSRFKWFFKY